jgi:hypothetical protein
MSPKYRIPEPHEIPKFCQEIDENEMNQEELHEKIKELEYLSKKFEKESTPERKGPIVKNMHFFDFKQRVKATPGVKYSEFIKRSKLSTVG